MTEQEQHNRAVERALAQRGITLAEHRANLARSTVAAAETALDTEAAQRRRSVGAITLSPGEPIRRNQWIEATAEVVATTRRRCSRLLPHHEAEELAADVLARELEHGAESGRKNHVRAERLTAKYLSLTARDWRGGREAERLSELQEDDDARDNLLSAEDTTSPEPAEVAHDDGPEVWRIYRQAAEAARRLYLPATFPIIASLAQGLATRRVEKRNRWTEEPIPAAELAPMWGIGVKVWEREAAIGGHEIRASYPVRDIMTAVSRLIPEDHNLSARETPLPKRRIGAKLPDKGRHLTAAQRTRDANLLLAPTPLTGRLPKASKASDGASRIIEPPEVWEIERTLTAADVLAPLKRLLAQRVAAESSPRRGRAAGHYSSGARRIKTAAPMRHSPESIPEIREAPMAGLLHTVAVSARLTDHPSTGAAADVLAHITRAESALRSIERAAEQDTPIRPTRPSRRPTRRESIPSAVLTEARASLARMLARESTESGRTLYRPTTTYNERHRLQTWTLVFAPAWKRPSMLAPCSLDTVTAAELERESARPFSMTADRETD